MLSVVRGLRRRSAMDATAVTTKPRVLLADDHVGMLESVARALGADFDVVGMVTDGRQALEALAVSNPT